MQERQRRSLTEEYKRQAAELVVLSGRSIMAVSKELGLRDSVLRRWVDKLRKERHRRRGAPARRRRRCRRTRLPRSSGYVRRTSGCAWNVTFKQTVQHGCAPVRRRNGLVLLGDWEGSGRSIIGGKSPLKNGPYVHANLRVVTSA
ncbi:transposase [Bradyrhizobium viridifuturi]|uniref:transposase n=1 Tax=Bradyrhizobium viridifuturi TaxID=1654716 RepID=UPI000FE13FEB